VGAENDFHIRSMSSPRKIELIPVGLRNLLRYNLIWATLLREREYQQWFGNYVSTAVRAWPWDIFRAGNCRKYTVALDGRDVGVGAIFIDRRNLLCVVEIGILPAYRGQHIGSEAGRMLISKCFREFSARRVEGSALSTNPRSIGMRDWMTLEATLKGRYWIGGQEVDELIYKITRAEWESCTRRVGYEQD
jgi:RimJ/RimL family protein N-acetyltransferase